MIRPRIIPVLLLHKGALTKTIRFSKHNYIGDPINTVNLFNRLKADELVFLDVDASKENRSISIQLVKEIGEEAKMPFSVGGGINDLETIAACINAGAERVILGEVMYKKPSFIEEAVKQFGSSTISVCIDYKTNWLQNTYCYFRNGQTKIKTTPMEQALLMEKLGVGEVILQSIDLDGTMTGFDNKHIEPIVRKLSIPVVALGGAGTFTDFEKLAKIPIRGIAAGSFFIYHGNNKGVLINYPSTLNKLH